MTATNPETKTADLKEIYGQICNAHNVIADFMPLQPTNQKATDMQFYDYIIEHALAALEWVAHAFTRRTS